MVLIKEFENRLFVGDAAKILKAIPDESVNLIVADPPYNLGKNYGKITDLKEWNEYERFNIKWLNEAVRVLKNTGSIYVFMGFRFISKLFLILECNLGLNFNGWIVWHYTQGMGRKKGFSPRHDDILYFTKSDKFVFNLDDVRIPQKYFRKRNNMAGANPGDVWRFSHVHYCSRERKNHPTQKPEALIERIICASSNENDIVLDPFIGSGTTCKVASVLKRTYIGIDINPEYVKLAEERIKEPFDGFDSIDERINRVPRDLPKGVSIMEDGTLFDPND
jgi:DNA modification methylase